MLNDEYRRPADVPVSGPPQIPAQRSHLSPPVTLGHPTWQRRYVSSAWAVKAGAAGCAPALYLVWKDLVHRPLLAAALSAVAMSVAGHGALRARLRRLRRRGRAMSTVLVVGTNEDVAALVQRTRCRPTLGWRVVGACTPTGLGPDGQQTVAGVPVLSDLDGVATLALFSHVDAVAVGPAPGWTAVRLGQLARDLDGSRTALLVDLRLVAAGPRARTAGLRGLPLQRLAHPTLAGPRRLLKSAIDRVLAFLLLLITAPLLLSCVLAVRRDGGPVFDRRPRLGRNGRTFAMLAFRTTSIDTGATTRVGRVLRERYLDELPQLLNVLGGSMAVVGPRPAVPGEAGYDDRAAQRRRLLVKPGITGLGQMRGPVDQPEASYLRYVERWSPALDARILVRAVRTAMAGTVR